MGQALSRLASDRISRFAVAVAVVIALIYVVPVFGSIAVERFDEFVAEPLVAALLLILLATALRKATCEERRFWRHQTAAFTCMLIGDQLHWIAVLVPPGFPAGLLWDFSYLLLYLFLALAAESRPHRRPGWSRDHPEYRFGSTGLFVFAFGMLSYFALIPTRVDATAYETLIPSYLLYIGLDVFLVLRFANLLRSARPRRWRAIYGTMTAALVFWVITDSLEAMNVSHAIYIGRSSPWVLLWFPAYFFIGAAARIGTLWPDTRSESPEPWEQATAVPEPRLAGGPLIALALAFPAMHFVLYAAGIVSPIAKPARELLVLVLLVVFGMLGWVQQRRLAARERRLQEDLERSRVELHAARRLESIGRLAGGVAHDFNNLLTAIQGATELVRRQNGPNEAAQRLFDTIESATSQARGLTQQLLAFGRKQHLEPRVVSLNRFVSESDDLLAGILGRDVCLRLLLKAEPGWIRVDPTQLGQVLLNLAANARDAMDGRGTFTVETREVDGEVMLEVHDTGHGMDAETLQQIFEPFFSTKERHRGTGLGLASVYGAIQQSGGRIDVASEPGVGTRFTIHFPRAEAPEQYRPAAEGHSPHPGSVTILVVDDEPSILSLLAELLEDEGYDVLTASDGSAAIELVQRQPAAIDLVLTDIAMPGMDGLELTQRMKALAPQLPTLFMTGYSAKLELIDRATYLGSKLIQKPFKCDELLRQIRSAIRPEISARL